MTKTLLLRSCIPIRSKVKPEVKYSLYKNNLRQDFMNACGYCGAEDVRVDRISFHIDHFAPQQKFPHLKNDYNNLVYACRFCNISKSDHWVGNVSSVPNDGEQGFIDPCSDEYDIHLERQESGKIVGKTNLGNYISRRLKLYLLRHELLWQARRARVLRDEVEALISVLAKKEEISTPNYVALLERFLELTKSIEDYEQRANN